MPTRKPAKPPAPAPFPGADRATAPMGVEEDSASAWQRFEELRKAFEAGQDTAAAPGKPQATVPASAYAATERMDIATAEAPAAATGVITLDQVMVLARRNNRACPVPAQWAAFHRLLSRHQPQGGVAPPAPVDGPGWAATSPMQKRLRLRDQLEWAERTGVLTEVGGFLAGLTEQDWHHFGD